jgi:hypothetical protein
MSARFQTYADLVTGIDFHEVDAPNMPYAAAAKFDAMPVNNGKLTANVTTCGARVLQMDFKQSLFPHVPFVPPATPVGYANVALTNVYGNANCFLAVSSVSGNKRPLACSIHEAFGLLFDCNGTNLGGARASGKLPTGVNGTTSTVKTQPTADDYLDAAIAMVVDIFLSTVTDAASRKLVKDRPGGRDKVTPKDLLTQKTADEVARQLLRRGLRKWVKGRLQDAAKWLESTPSKPSEYDKRLP